MKKDHVKDNVEFWKGQMIEIHVHQEEEEEIYESEIDELLESDILIQCPMNREQQPFPARYDEDVVIYFYDDFLGMCKFETSIRCHEGQYSFPIPSKESIEKVQRRRFFRIPLNIELDVMVSSGFAVKQPHKVVTCDISGGGFSFYSSDEWRKDVILEGTLRLVKQSDELDIPFIGKVVNCVILDHSKYKVGVEFMEMNETTRSEIIRYCMHRQIEMHKKLKRPTR